MGRFRIVAKLGVSTSSCVMKDVAAGCEHSHGRALDEQIDDIHLRPAEFAVSTTSRPG
jgi:hypothetical protein